MHSRLSIGGSISADLRVLNGKKFTSSIIMSRFVSIIIEFNYEL